MKHVENQIFYHLDTKNSFEIENEEILFTGEVQAIEAHCF